MLYILTGMLWVASVNFINPATKNVEYVRTIPTEIFQNNSLNCVQNLQRLVEGVDKLNMVVDAAWCTQIRMDDDLKEHGIAIKGNE